jgi:hypothetical protein
MEVTTGREELRQILRCRYVVNVPAVPFIAGRISTEGVYEEFSNTCIE